MEKDTNLTADKNYDKKIWLPLQFFNKFEFAPSNSPIIGLIGFKNLR